MTVMQQINHRLQVHRATSSYIGLDHGDDAPSRPSHTHLRK